MLNTVTQGDCLEVMRDIPDSSVDMILCDLPYGSSECAWDSTIPFEPLWELYKRIVKPKGAVVLTASQPFTSALVMSNQKWFRYEWIWQKTIAANFAQANKRPLKRHESILVFSRGATTYNPQMEEGEPYQRSAGARAVGVHRQGTSIDTRQALNNRGTRYPSSIKKFPNPNNGSLHPTQKPVTLFEYLIRTYTNEGETVLDNCAGSGTTAIACLNTGRDYLCIEQHVPYVDVCNQRIAKWHTEHDTPLFATAAD